MERLVQKIDTIMPTDRPARLAWQRMQRVGVSRFGTVDLDKLGIEVAVSTHGVHGPIDGMHRLARVLDKRGYCQVVFTPKTGYEDWIDYSLEQSRREGMYALQDFLVMCKSGNFPREDTG